MLQPCKGNFFLQKFIDEAKEPFVAFYFAKHMPMADKITVFPVLNRLMKILDNEGSDAFFRWGDKLLQILHENFDPLEKEIEVYMLKQATGSQKTQKIPLL